MSMEDDIFGTDICIDSLEVFGAGVDIPASSPRKKRRSVQREKVKEEKEEETIAQMDGADTDSSEDEDMLVMAIEEQETETPARRVTRSTVSSGRGTGRGTGETGGTGAGPAVKDKEAGAAAPENEVETTVANNETDITVANSETTTVVANKEADTAVTNKEADTTVTNKEATTAVTNKEATTAVANQEGTTAVANKETDTEKIKADSVESATDSDSDSDSDGDDAAVQLLYQKKMQQMSQMKVEINSSQELEQEQEAAKVPPDSNVESREVSANDSENTSVVAEDLFGSGSESCSDDAVSPVKKLRPLSSSEDERDTELKAKLAEIGKENANLEKVKKKVVLEKKLELLGRRKAEISAQQGRDRKQRNVKREKGRDSSTDEKGGRGRDTSTDEEEREEKGRFDKFSSSRISSRGPSGEGRGRGKTGGRGGQVGGTRGGGGGAASGGGGGGFLDSLLDGQESLLSRDGARKGEEATARPVYKGEMLENVAEGLGDPSLYQVSWSLGMSLVVTSPQLC